jgi:hypothetical protein
MSITTDIPKLFAAEPSEAASEHRKNACLEVKNALSPIATFVCGFTLSAFFSIRCPESLTAAFLRSASILFLSTTLALLTIPMILQSSPKGGSMISLFILLQISLATLVLAAGLTFVALAFYFYSPPSLIGIGGIMLISAMSILCLVYRLLFNHKEAFREIQWVIDRSKGE